MRDDMSLSTSINDVIIPTDMILEEVANFDFPNNRITIPLVWSRTIVDKHGNPQWSAQHILAIILSWWMPSNGNGNRPKGSKRFDADMPQISIKKFAEDLSLSEARIRTALRYLESDLHVIKRHYRSIVIQGGNYLNNVLYIELMPERLKELTPRE